MLNGLAGFVVTYPLSPPLRRPPLRASKVSAFGESRELVLTPSRSNLVVQSCYFLYESSSRDLQFEHGFKACFQTNKRNSLDFHILFGGGNTEEFDETLGHAKKMR